MSSYEETISGGSGSGSGTKNMDIIEELKLEAAIKEVSDMLGRLTAKCYKTCVERPSNSLNDREQKCLGMCADRYLESFNLVARTYGKRLEQEGSKIQLD